MTIRNAVIGLAVVFGLSVWSWCRPSGSQSHARGAELVHASTESEVGNGSNREEAMARFRGNMSRHWRQVAVGGGGTP